MVDFVKVGEKIAYLRKENGYTQDDLATKLFVTRQALSKWEQGLSNPSIDTIITLCQLFNCSFEELLCLKEEIKIDKNNIFAGHSRYFIINNIINNKIDIKLSDCFYQFSTEERYQVLKAIKDGKMAINKDDLADLSKKLTNAELAFMGLFKEVKYEIEEGNH